MVRHARETDTVTPVKLSLVPRRDPIPPQRNGSSAACRAYLVEDNAVIRRNLEETLTELAGVQTVGYSETEQGACIWLAHHPADWQLLIVDLFLLQGSGLGVVRKCTERNDKQRVVVLSNYATADIRQRCMADGADAVFDKSTELDQFLAYCRRH